MGVLIEQWVSTHPNEDLNIDYIDTPWDGLGCSTNISQHVSIFSTHMFEWKHHFPCPAEHLRIDSCCFLPCRMWSLLSVQCCSDVDGTHQLALFLYTTIRVSLTYSYSRIELLHMSVMSVTTTNTGDPIAVPCTCWQWSQDVIYCESCPFIPI